MEPTNEKIEDAIEDGIMGPAPETAIAVHSCSEKMQVISPNYSPEALLFHAVDRQVPVEMMERLLAMQASIKAGQAKEAFDEAMAMFQGECPVIEKKTSGYQNAYHYATLDAIVSAVKGLLQVHGFSYQVKTTTEFNDAGAVTIVRATCIVKHRTGHSEQSEFVVPLGKATSMMSAPQAVAASLTFAKRYAFVNAFGIMTGDADTDATVNEVPHAAPSTPATGLPPTTSQPPAATTPPAATPEAPVADAPQYISDKQKAYVTSMCKQKGVDALGKLAALNPGFHYGSLHNVPKAVGRALIDHLKVLPNAPKPEVPAEQKAEQPPAADTGMADDPAINHDPLSGSGTPKDKILDELDLLVDQLPAAVVNPIIAAGPQNWKEATIEQLTKLRDTIQAQIPKEERA